MFLFYFLFAAIHFLPMAMEASAGDKIGNGGGLWSCTAGALKENSQLVDFYEATHEFGLTLAPTSEATPFAIVNEVALRLQSALPDYSIRWSTILADVKSRVRYLDSELEIVDDALFRIRPLPSPDCAVWSYIQFANYTHYNALLIRKDLWESGFIGVLDKAGLVWHEVIYRWMREDFGDKDSSRTRQIVGLIFSTLGSQELRSSIQKVLQQDDGHKDPSQEIWICMTRNSMTSRYFLEYGPNELFARNQVIQSCQQSDVDESFYCRQHQVPCESFTSMQFRFTCAVRNNLSEKIFTEMGRSPLEAEAKALRACSDSDRSTAFHCSERVECQ